MPHPTPDDQRTPPSDPAFAPDERLRSAQVEHFNHWQDLVDKRLIDTMQESRPNRSPRSRRRSGAWGRAEARAAGKGAFQAFLA